MLIEISDFIHANPELGHEEFKSSKLLCDVLEAHGFDVTRGAADIPTAFVAEYKSGKEGPVIAFNAEYDALPEMGHGCGHQVIASSAIGAGITIKPLMDHLGGTIRVIGTPAEESTSDKGVFADVDFCFQCHPNDRTMSDARFKAISKLEFKLYGLASHASRAPEKGISACDAATLGYIAVEMLREHITDDVRIHGIITNGGSAANTVPDYSSVEYGVRANSSEVLEDVVERVCNCFRGAAIATGAKLEIIRGKTMQSNLLNKTLNDVVLRNAIEGGAKQVLPQETMASTDFANVTRIMPAVRLDIAFVEVGTSTHSPAFAACGNKPMAHEAVITSAYAMAATAYELFTDPELCAKAKAEFAAANAK